MGEYVADPRGVEGTDQIRREFLEGEDVDVMRAHRIHDGIRVRTAESAVERHDSDGGIRLFVVSASSCVGRIGTRFTICFTLGFTGCFTLGFTGCFTQGEPVERHAQHDNHRQRHRGNRQRPATQHGRNNGEQQRGDP